MTCHKLLLHKVHCYSQFVGGEGPLVNSDQLIGQPRDFICSRSRVNGKQWPVRKRATCKIQAGMIMFGRGKDRLSDTLACFS